MSRLDKLVGTTMLHKDFGEVQVLSRVPRSRTKLNIKVVQRAKGWSVVNGVGHYKPVKTVRPNLDENGNEMGKTIHYKIYSDKSSQYGHEDVVHVDELTKVEKQ